VLPNNCSHLTFLKKTCNITSFLQWTAPNAHSFCEGCTCHHHHILVTAPLCCDWKAWVASVQSFTLWQQATIDITRRAHSNSACSWHLYMCVVLHTHPVRGKSHIQQNSNRDVATCAARIYLTCWNYWKRNSQVKCQLKYLINDLNSNLLKQRWEPFSNLSGPIS